MTDQTARSNVYAICYLQEDKCVAMVSIAGSKHRLAGWYLQIADMIQATRYYGPFYSPREAFLSGLGQLPAEAQEPRETKASPVAWLHTITYETGEIDVLVKLTDKNAFGTPGRDYGATYPVTIEPLYRGSVETSAPRCADCGVMLVPEARHFSECKSHPGERAVEPSGVKCTHCNGTGEETQVYDEANGGWSPVRACDTCRGSGRIHTVEQYLKTLPADWHEDSSLETWFPLTAEELERWKREVSRLRGIANVCLAMKPTSGTMRRALEKIDGLSVEASDRPDPGVAPAPWPEECAERIRARIRHAAVKNHDQVHVLRDDLEQLFRWIALRNGTRGLAANALACSAEETPDRSPVQTNEKPVAWMSSINPLLVTTHEEEARCWNNPPIPLYIRAVETREQRTRQPLADPKLSVEVALREAERCRRYRDPVLNEQVIVVLADQVLLLHSQLLEHAEVCGESAYPISDRSPVETTAPPCGRKIRAYGVLVSCSEKQGHGGLHGADSPDGGTLSWTDLQELCEDCPPLGHSTDETRCTPCPRRAVKATETPQNKNGMRPDCLQPKDCQEDSTGYCAACHAVASL